MEAIDRNKLDTAISYVERIADGKNPVTGVEVGEDTVLNNPNVIRCMFFIKEVLEGVRCNGGYIGSKPKKSELADFPLDLLQSYTYREDKPITKLVEQLNEPVDESQHRKLSYKPITQWLKLNGFLQDDFNTELNKNVTEPTEKGRQIGISSEKRRSMAGAEYIRVIYGREAQEFIVQNLERILNGEEAQ
ncbi:MAG: hypothetical protein LUI13_09645 [Lachnospiraceae bacterium]|nr:hypothetical protein [Lachnospiraceae bacterium]